MDYSTRISERMWNQPDKGELEAERENTFIDDIVQKSHIEKGTVAGWVKIIFLQRVKYEYMRKRPVNNTIIQKYAKMLQ